VKKKHDSMVDWFGSTWLEDKECKEKDQYGRPILPKKGERDNKGRLVDLGGIVYSERWEKGIRKSKRLELTDIRTVLEGVTNQFI
jgi:hypothetical protein